MSRETPESEMIARTPVTKEKQKRRNGMEVDGGEGMKKTIKHQRPP